MVNSIYTKAVLVLTRGLLVLYQLGKNLLSGLSALVLRRGRSDCNGMRGASGRGAFGLSLLLYRVVVRHTTEDL